MVDDVIDLDEKWKQETDEAAITLFSQGEVKFRGLRFRYSYIAEVVWIDRIDGQCFSDGKSVLVFSSRIVKKPDPPNAPSMEEMLEYLKKMMGNANYNQKEPWSIHGDTHNQNDQDIIDAMRYRTRFNNFGFYNPNGYSTTGE